MNSWTRGHLYVLISFAAISLIVTWPLVLRFGQGIPYGGDGFQFIWNGWWMSKALADPNFTTAWTTYQAAPEGSSLLMHDFSLLNAWFQALLSPIIGQFQSYNLLILLNYILSAWGAYILAWYFTGNRAGSVIAGVIYGFSTFHAMHLSQLSTVSMGWLPLSIYYLLKFTRDGGWRDGVFAVLMLSACAMSHWYHFIWAFVTFFLLVLFGQIGLREHVGGRERIFRALIPWLVVALLFNQAIVNSVFYIDRMEVLRRSVIGSMYFVDPAWLVLPPPTHPFLGGVSEGYKGIIPMNTTEGIVSLGIVAIFLGLFSWTRKNPTTRAWWWIGAFMLLMSLGRELVVAGHSLMLPGPFALWVMVPGLDLIRAPARFVEPFTLALAMSSAGWIAGLGLDWHKGAGRNFLLYVIPAFLILETLTIPIPISGSEYLHPEFSNLKQLYMDATGSGNPPDLAVNFPILPPQTQYLLQQTIHDIPTMDTELSISPPEVLQQQMTVYVEPEESWNPDVARHFGIDLVILHPKESLTAYPYGVPFRGTTLSPVEFFKQFDGYKTAYEDDDLVVFVLDHPALLPDPE